MEELGEELMEVEAVDAAALRALSPVQLGAVAADVRQQQRPLETKDLEDLSLLEPLAGFEEDDMTEEERALLAAWDAEDDSKRKEREEEQAKLRKVALMKELEPSIATASFKRSEMERKYKPSKRIRKVMETVGVSKSKDVSTSNKLKQLEETITRDHDKDEDMLWFRDVVLRWRQRGAALLEDRTGVDLAGLVSLVNLLISDAAIEQVRLKWIPEMQHLYELLNEFQSWMFNDIRDLVKTRHLRARRGEKIEIPSEKIKYDDLRRMSQIAAEKFSHMRHPVVSSLLDLSVLANGLSEKASRLLGTLTNKDVSSEDLSHFRPRTKTLESFWHDLHEMKDSLSQCPAEVPLGAKIEEYCALYYWRKRLRTELILPNNRVFVSHLSENPDVSKEKLDSVVFTKNVTKDLRDLENLMEEGKVLGAPMREKLDDMTDLDDAEELFLMKRLKALVQQAHQDRDAIKKSLAEVANLTSEGTSSLDERIALLKPLDDNGRTGLLSGPKGNDEENKSPRGVWFPERDTLSQTLRILEWYSANKSKVEEAQGFNGFDDFARDNDEAKPPSEGHTQAMQKVGALLNDFMEEIGLSDFDTDDAMEIEDYFSDQENEHDASFLRNGNRDSFRQVLSWLPDIAEAISALRSLSSQLRTSCDAKIDKWRRSLVGGLVEEQKKGEHSWSTVKVIAYKNQAKLHFAVSDDGSQTARALRFDPDGKTYDMNGDEISFWRPAPAGKSLEFSSEEANQKLKDQIASISKQLNEMEARKKAQESRRRKEQERRRNAKRGGKAAKSSREIDSDDEANNEGALPFDEAIVGQFVKVEWKPGEYWLGFVQKYIPRNNIHIVAYRDGNFEQMTLAEDGSAVSSDGTETFSWINTSEKFRIDTVFFFDELDLDQDGAVSEYSGSSDESYGDDVDDDFEAGNEYDLHGAAGKEKAGAKKRKKEQRKGLRDQKKKRKKTSTSAAGHLGRLLSVKQDPWLDPSKNPSPHDEELVKRFQAGRTLLEKILAGKSETSEEKFVKTLAKEIMRRLLKANKIYQWDETDRCWKKMKENEKAWLNQTRTLLQHLKRDATLRQALLEQKLTPKALVRMKPEELTSKETREKLEKKLKLIKQSSMIETRMPLKPVDAEKEREERLQNAALGKKELSAKKQRKLSEKKKKAEAAAAAAATSKKGALHPIDQKLAAAAAASGASVVENETSSEKESNKLSVASPDAKPLPSLRAMLSMGEEKEEPHDSKRRDAEQRRDKRGRTEQDLRNKFEKEVKHRKLQRLTWTGILRFADVEFNLVPDETYFGNAIKPELRLLGSASLAFLGKTGQTFELAGKCSIPKALEYLQTVAFHPKSSRQINMFRIKVVGSASPWDDLVRSERVGIINFEAVAVLIYLVPPVLVKRFADVSAKVLSLSQEEGLGFIVVKPSVVPGIEHIVKNIKPMAGERDPQSWIKPARKSFGSLQAPPSATVSPKSSVTIDSKGLQGLLNTLRRQNNSNQGRGRGFGGQQGQAHGHGLDSSGLGRGGGPLGGQDVSGRPPLSEGAMNFIRQTADYCKQNGARDGRSAFMLLQSRLNEYPFIQLGHPEHDIFLNFLRQ